MTAETIIIFLIHSDRPVYPWVRGDDSKERDVNRPWQRDTHCGCIDVRDTMEIYSWWPL